MVTTKVGMSKSEPERFPPYHTILSTNADYSFPPISPSSPESNDPEFEDYQRNFTLLETAADKFLKDTRTFTDAVNSMCRVTSPFMNTSLIGLFASTLHVWEQPRAAFLYPLSSDRFRV